MPRKLAASLNIRARLLLLCLGVAAPLLAIGAYSIWKQYQTLHNEAKRATTLQAAMAARTLSRWVAAQEDALAALAGLPAMKAASPQAVRPVLTAAVQARADWHGVALVSPEGREIASSSGETAFSPQDLAAQPFFREALDAGRAAVSGYLRCPETGRFALMSAAPVSSGGRVAAVVVACIQPDAVLKLFQGLGESSGSVIVVIDQNNHVIARTLDNDLWVGRDYSRAKTVTAASKTWRGTLEAVGIADPTPRAYAFERDPATGWLVIVGVPTAAIYGEANDWLIMMLLGAACAVAVSLALALAATGHFTKPINQMVREALAIGRGDLTKRVEVPTGDELGLLARAFNQMAANLELNEEHKLMVENIAEAVRQSLDLEQVLVTTVRELGKALSASRCCLALIDARSPADLSDDVLVFDYSWWDSGRAGTPLSNRTVPMSEQSLLKAMLFQGSVMSLDVLDGTSMAPLFQNADALADEWRSIKSLIACPIVTREKPLGIILVHQCDRLRTWTDSELTLVEAVARHVALAMEHARLYAQSKTLAEQELLINHIVRAVRSSLDLDTILNTVTRELGEALSADRCQIGLPSQEGPLVITHEHCARQLRPVKGLNIYGQEPGSPAAAPKPGTSASILGIRLDSLSGGADSTDGATLKDAPLAVIADVSTSAEAAAFTPFLEAAGSRSLIAAPLLDNNRLLGLLMVHQCSRQRSWAAAEASLVAAIADQVAVAVSHARLFAQVRHQAMTDGLTGLYNHIYLKKRLSDELRRAQRKGAPLSLLMIDLDRLKQINDTHGHPVGDAAIRQVSWTLKNLLRGSDTAARYGGEEFAVILPETPVAEAALIAERLCRQVNRSPVPGLGKISVSIGAAGYPTEAGSLEELVERADRALYVAKHAGRNQVRVWPCGEAQEVAGITPGA